ncbi:MAG: hypothetical protein R2755_26115 [Acidimicrobiales bacterium]
MIACDECQLAKPVRGIDDGALDPPVDLMILVEPSEVLVGFGGNAALGELERCSEQLDHVGRVALAGSAGEGLDPCPVAADLVGELVPPAVGGDRQPVVAVGASSEELADGAEALSAVLRLVDDGQKVSRSVCDETERW